METCSLNDFMEELNPWLDKDYIKEVHVDNKGHFILYFRDGMKNVYSIDDCNKSQVAKIIITLKSKGIQVLDYQEILEQSSMP